MWCELFRWSDLITMAAVSMYYAGLRTWKLIFNSTVKKKGQEKGAFPKRFSNQRTLNHKLWVLEWTEKCLIIGPKLLVKFAITHNWSMSHLQVLWTVSTKTLAVDRKEVNKRKRAKKGRKKWEDKNRNALAKRKRKTIFGLCAYA